MKAWEALDKAITEVDPLKECRTINLYPSEASLIDPTTNKAAGGCVRKGWLRFKTAIDQNNKPKDIHAKKASLDVHGEPLNIVVSHHTPRSEWIFKAGNTFESMIIQVARRGGILHSGHKRFKIPVKHDLFLAGEVDAVFRDGSTLVGIEIKSTHGYMAEKKIIHPKYGEPKLEHLLQTALYAWYYRDQIPYFQLLYILRGKLQRREFKISIHELDDGDFGIKVDDMRTPYRISHVLDRYTELAEYIHENYLPPRDFELIFDDDQMNELNDNNELGKTLGSAWEKYWDRKVNGGRKVQRPEKGHFQCSYCQFKDVCYKKDGTPYDMTKYMNPKDTNIMSLESIAADTVWDVVKFYQLTWPFKETLMERMNVDTVEEAAELFNQDQKKWIQDSELEQFSLIMRKYRE